MKRAGELAGTRAKVAVIVAVASFWTWINLFHDAGSAYYHLMGDSFVSGRPFGVYLSCGASPVGMAAGALAAFALNRKRATGPKELVGGLAGCLALQGLFYASAELTRSYVPTSALSFLVFALGTFLFFRCVLARLPFEKRDIIPLAIACITVRKAVLVLTTSTLTYEPVVVMGSFHLLFLALFTGALTFLTKQGGCTPAAHKLAETAPAPSARKPWPLFTHLVCYGMGFGIAHGMLGFGDYVTFTYSLSGLLEIPFAAALVMLCVRNVARTETLWQRIRGVVFPMAVIGYSLIIVTLSPSLPSFIVEAASGVYGALFLLGCLMMSRETGLSLVGIACLGVVFEKAGFSLGVLFGYLFGGSGVFASQTTATIMFIGVFIAFSAGTFWIGSEQSMRKWWGLRKEKSPEHQHLQLLLEKCALLAREHNLSAREREVLAMLAEGKRPAQIKEECGLSISTVRGHIQHVYDKLDVHSAAELDSLVKNVHVVAPSLL